MDSTDGPNTLTEVSADYTKVERDNLLTCVEMDLYKKLIPSVIMANTAYNVP